MSILQYLKVKKVLPSPEGPLSREVPSSSIQAANKSVSAIFESEVATGSEVGVGTKKGKRGTYEKHSPEEKAKVGNYAVLHGTSAAIQHFKSKHPDLKWSTVNDWKKAVIAKTKRNYQTGQVDPITELESKKRGRPAMLNDELSKDLQLYIEAIRTSGGVVNTAILIAAATGMLQVRDPGALECNGGHIVLRKGWAKYFLEKMQFVKRKATTKAKPAILNFEEIKHQYLIDIKAIVEMAEIPNDLIINWDQTAIKYVPVSQWTMERVGSKRVEIAGLDDKRQITAVFAGSLTGDFLPIQLIYQGKTEKCYPAVSFPENWHITCTPTHWCNEQTMLDYISKIIIPYFRKKRADLGLSATHPALAIFDEFTGQVTEEALALLDNNNIYYVIVPPNCTDKLQPLDISVNKPAKEYLRSKFQSWYASKITSQLQADVSSSALQPVPMQLSIMKPIGAKWMMDLYDYIKSKPEFVINGFRNVGIVDIIES